MAHYAGPLLYLVPVVVAGVVAFFVSRPDKRPDRRVAERPDRRLDTRLDRRLGKRQHKPARRVRVATVELPPTPPQRRAKDKPLNNVVAHPTLMHAALSTHLTAVSGARSPTVKPRTGSAQTGSTQAGSTQAASLAASVSAQHAAARLVSIRRPARIPRRPVHRCPHKP